MTPFKLLMIATGLTQREAADFNRVPPATVNNWSSGKSRTPPGAIDDMRRLYAMQRTAADAALDKIDENDADVIELGLASDDHEARSIGWPCVGAQQGMLAMIVAEAVEKTFVIVPRGSTVPSARAAEVLERHD